MKARQTEEEMGRQHQEMDREWTCLEFAKSQRGVEKKGEMEGNGCEIKKIMWCPNDPRG